MRMLVLVLLLSFTEQGDDDVTVTSKGPQERDGPILHAKDDVIATYRDMRFEGDTLDYNRETMQLTAGERVRFTRGVEKLEGARLDFNVATKSGTITDARGQLGGFFITAGEVRRLEDGTYELRNATITACDNCDNKDRPDWTFNMAFFVIDPQKRFTARNTVFRFQKLPVFYMPYITAPSVDRERSTGFLIPVTLWIRTIPLSVTGPSKYTVR